MSEQYFIKYLIFSIPLRCFSQCIRTQLIFLIQNVKVYEAKTLYIFYYHFFLIVKTSKPSALLPPVLPPVSFSESLNQLWSWSHHSLLRLLLSLCWHRHTFKCWQNFLSKIFHNSSNFVPLSMNTVMKKLKVLFVILTFDFDFGFTSETLSDATLCIFLDLGTAHKKSSFFFI